MTDFTPSKREATARAAGRRALASAGRNAERRARARHSLTGPDAKNERRQEEADARREALEDPAGPQRPRLAPVLDYLNDPAAPIAFAVIWWGIVGGLVTLVTP